VKITVPLLRDLVMLVLGSAGMAQEMFVAPELDMKRVSLCLALLLGPAGVHTLLRMRNPPSDQLTPTGGTSPPPRSSSRRRGS
jgi:hypothetical protein